MSVFEFIVPLGLRGFIRGKRDSETFKASLLANSHEETLVSLEVTVCSRAPRYLLPNQMFVSLPNNRNCRICEDVCEDVDGVCEDVKMSFLFRHYVESFATSLQGQRLLKLILLDIILLFSMEWKGKILL